MDVSVKMHNNGCVYETFGISKHFPVKLPQLLIRGGTLDNPLTAKCFIYDVTGWASCLFVMVQFPKSTIELVGYFVLVALRCILLLRNTLRHYSFALAFSLLAEFQFLS